MLLQAFMLEQAAIQPGMRVVEIGSGGCNAAVIAELVGADGEVTTMDIDPEVTSRAENLLAAAGYPQVRVVLGDGEYGEPAHAPFDRIVVTVGAADLAPAWVAQLAAGGRLVVPLRVRGLTRSVVFESANGYLAGLDYELCRFVPTQGAGENRGRVLVLRDDACGGRAGLRLEGGEQVDDDLLRAAFAGPAADAWSGVTAGPTCPTTIWTCGSRRRCPATVGWRRPHGHARAGWSRRRPRSACPP